MLTIVTNNLGTIFISLAILLAAALAFRSIRKTRAKGGCCGCEGCAQAGQCGGHPTKQKP